MWQNLWLSDRTLAAVQCIIMLISTEICDHDKIEE